VKRLMVLAAAVGMGLCLARPAQAGPMFPDVPTTHWAFDAVRALAAKGIIEGYPAVEVKPPAARKPAPATQKAHGRTHPKARRSQPRR
jgi:hypothetical protein